MKYEVNRFADEVVWYYEPHVGEQMFQEMLKQAGVAVRLGERLLEKDGVTKQGTKILDITTNLGTYRLSPMVLATAFNA